MSTQEILDTLKDILLSVKPRLDVSGLSMDANLPDELGIDSFSMLLLSLAAEQKFGIRFEPDRPFVKVSEIVEYVSSRIR